MPMLHTFPHITSYRFICIEFLCCSLKKPRHIYDAVNPAKTINTGYLPTCSTFGQGQLCVSTSEASHLTIIIMQCHQICLHLQNYVILWTESRIPYETTEYSPDVFSKYLFSIFLQALQLRGNFKMFPESLHSWEIQNSTAISAICTSKWFPCATTHFCQRP